MKPRTWITFIMASIWLLMIFSLIMLVNTVASGDQLYKLLSLDFAGAELTFALKFDALSAPMFSMVTLLGIVIGHFSIRHLHGEERQVYFFKHLLGIIGSVSCLVLAENLFVFFVMWVLTGHHLHRLLLFYPDRLAAREAAYKKLLTCRIGDFAILVAIILMYWGFGQTNFTQLFLAESNTHPFWLTEIVSLLLVVGAVSKSALIPFHGWLPDTLESPTPVSALMHAGVINAGGFLVIRFSPILQTSHYAHALLLLLGAATASYSSLIMMSQNSIKKKLAYSTISQMGMMMFACGLGAYSIALFHIVAHSFYKAHSFLATGYIVEESKKLQLQWKTPSLALTAFIAVTGLTAIGFGSWYQSGEYLALFVYASVMVLALFQNRFHKPESAPVPYFSIVGILILGLCAYLGLESIVAHLLQGTVPGLSETFHIAKNNLFSLAASFLMFVTAFYLSARLTNPDTVPLKRLYIHLWNGGISIRPIRTLASKQS